ncbi:MAG: hypothetical protein ABI670_01170 [Chloroflexota bacterium]
MLSPTGDRYLDDELDSDDQISVQLDDTLTFEERARLFGIEGLDRSKWSGKMGLSGPIPSEEYLQRVITAYGPGLRRSFDWYVPFEVVKQVQSGKLQGAAAINAAGEALLKFCEEGHFHISGTPSVQDTL